MWQKSDLNTGLAGFEVQLCFQEQLFFLRGTKGRNKVWEGDGERWGPTQIPVIVFCGLFEFQSIVQMLNFTFIEITYFTDWEP